ncbi:metal transporter CNNM [Entomortierella parvispora]|uniref:Metal transporter CNNM n=1 Tax=Entomortierella parvispora TaxID=205924 RepID=A0A9P3HFH2_9FUNG|nr:metal transporter CNNM [Entomortierella parvispora]
MAKAGLQRSGHGLSATLSLAHNHDPQTLKSEHPNGRLDQQCQGASKHERFAIQRALGFKNVVIYILLFLNIALITRMFSNYHRAPSKHCRGHASHSSDFTLWTLPEQEHEGEDATSIDFWIKMGLIVFLVMIGGIFAGLTIGLMGLDETNLHVLMASGSSNEQVNAEIVFSLLSRGKHWVLVTLLLGNVIVNETLPVVLDSELGGGVVAILISTLLIVIFGEIIPQAVCARYGLAIGAYCAKPMLVFMYIMSPAAYPIAMLLDSWLGVHHGTTYRRTELKTLVSLHQVDGIGELTDDEVTIIASVLDLKEKPVSMVMTPLEDVFTLSEDAILDEELMEEIMSAGFSRIPIYRHDDPSNFIGMLLVKRLITYDPEDHIAVRQFAISSLPEAAPNTSCLDILNFFQEGRSHMAIVTSEPGGFGLPVGVITLEDVIEELLGEEIVDESDVYVDIHNKIRVIRKPVRNVHLIKNLKSLLQSPALSDAALVSAAVSPHLPAPATLPGYGAVTGHSAPHQLAVPVEHSNAFIASGKTILQSQQSDVAEAKMSRHNSTVEERQALLEQNGSRHNCAFKTGGPSKPPSLPKEILSTISYGSTHNPGSPVLSAAPGQVVIDMLADDGSKAKLPQTQGVHQSDSSSTLQSMAEDSQGAVLTTTTPLSSANASTTGTSPKSKKKKKKSKSSRS